jgi:hypothetical protein
MGYSYGFGNVLALIGGSGEVAPLSGRRHP